MLPTAYSWWVRHLCFRRCATSFSVSRKNRKPRVSARQLHNGVKSWNGHEVWLFQYPLIAEPDGSTCSGNMPTPKVQMLFHARVRPKLLNPNLADWSSPTIGYAAQCSTSVEPLHDGWWQSSTVLRASLPTAPKKYIKSPDLRLIYGSFYVDK